MEEEAEHSRPAQSPREQQNYEDGEVAVLQRFISSDSSLSPKQQQMSRQNLIPGVRSYKLRKLRFRSCLFDE